MLALARAGSTSEAARRFAEYGLTGVEDEDVAALEARIAKDVALAEPPGKSRMAGAARSAGLYEAIFERTRGYYPGINAATLWLVADDVSRARSLAGEALTSVGGDDSYYGAATVAEAQLILGDFDSAAEALTAAARLHGGDWAAVATTRRQLRIVCDLAGADVSVLDPLAGPAVAHFCGHRIAAPGATGRFSADAEPAVAECIRAALEEQPVGYGYGALASGADILWAEALVRSGAELHVVLPFAREEFVQTSVADSGAAWVERFERLVGRAAGVSYATDDAFLGDDVLYRYGSELAMGLALLRARYLDAEVRQLAVWDGAPAAGEAGTAIDVATWAHTGRPATIVTPEGTALTTPPPAPAPDVEASGGRVVRALLFADMKGFSKLTDEQLPRFAEHVLGAFARVLARYTDAIGHSNTWGDALYVVMRDARAAAACANDLQEAMDGLDLEALGLPPHLELRLGGHLGPVFPVVDPVLSVPAFMGSHVSRTARIEPVTPPGAIYVTEPFAAALVLSGSDYAADYVGHMPASKDYGRLRMYRLRPSVSPGARAPSATA